MAFEKLTHAVFLAHGLVVSKSVCTITMPYLGGQVVIRNVDFYKNHGEDSDLTRIASAYLYSGGVAAAIARALEFGYAVEELLNGEALPEHRCLDFGGEGINAWHDQAAPRFLLLGLEIRPGVSMPLLLPEGATEIDRDLCLVSQEVLENGAYRRADWEQVWPQDVPLIPLFVQSDAG